MSTPYRLTGRIEEGDLAELYKATHSAGGDVVVKLFHPRTSDPAYAREVAETARHLSVLSHPGIVQYVDIGFVKNRLAVVRDYVDGFTLGTALHRLHTKEVLLPAPLALYFIIQLLEATQAAHDVGVIHGAITPGNVQLSREGVPSLTDFGALRALMAVPQLKATFAGRGRGAYRAPEVTRGDPATEQADVYSLGALAYELLTLREPAAQGGGISTRRESLPPPSRLDRRINSRLDAIIMRALELTPQRRFRSCGEFSSALRNFLGASGGLPGPGDLGRFAAELFPNEVSIVTLGPVPFSEPFKLTPVSGADIAHLRAEALDQSVVIRPTFSRSALTEEEANAPTMEAPPAFEEFKPPETSRPTELELPKSPWEPESTVQDAPSAEPSDEETRVASMSWEAPPGAEPPKPQRRQPQAVPLGGEADSPQLSLSGRHPRMKVVEDYSVPLTEETQVPTVTRLPPSLVRPNAVALAHEAASATRVGKAPRERPHPVVETVLFRPESRAEAQLPDRPEIPMPPPTSESVPVQGKRGRATQLRLRAFENRRTAAMAVVGGLVVVGVLAFLTAAWQLNAPEPPAVEPVQAAEPPLDPKATAVSGPLQEFLEKQQAQEARPPRAAESPRPKPATSAERATASAPKDSAFLTLRTNIPARVSIDGERVNQRTPLKRFPVKPGSRTILVEAIGTSERRQFSLRFEEGQHRVLEETFTKTPRR